MAWKRPQFPFWFFPGGRQWRLPVALAGRRRSRAAEQFQVLVVSASVRAASSSYADGWMDGCQGGNYPLSFRFAELISIGSKRCEKKRLAISAPAELSATAKPSS